MLTRSKIDFKNSKKAVADPGIYKPGAQSWCAGAGSAFGREVHLSFMTNTVRSIIFFKNRNKVYIIHLSFARKISPYNGSRKCVKNIQSSR